MELSTERRSGEQTLTASVFLGGDNVPVPGMDDLRHWLDERDEKFCHLLQCFLSARVIDRRLLKKLAGMGIEIDAVRECVKEYCVKSRRVLTEGPVDKHGKPVRHAEVAKRSTKAAASSRQQGFVEMQKPKRIKETKRVPMPKHMPLFPSRDDIKKMRKEHGSHSEASTEQMHAAKSKRSRASRHRGRGGK